ncbi:HNH endonuclease [Enterococcus faecium]|nr:HNH endonuclease [Enterococcus faecium]
MVHHKTEVKEDWDKRLDYDTLESICQSCHNKEHKKAYNLKRL